jgi:endonuclease/exonuclease/phosphatase family metal-dependent hydrolase
MKNCAMGRVWPLLFSALLPSPLPGQIPLTDGTYSQNFDALASNGAAIWVDNETLAGWYASQSAAPNCVTNYIAGAGAGTKGGLYSFGDVNSADRALGSLASGGPGKLAFGVRLRNDTRLAQTGFKVSCTGEQWRVGGTAVQKLAFSCQIGAWLTNADASDDQSWTVFPALDFNSPNTNATQALKGNDPSNQVVFTGVPLPGVVVPPGQELFLRWFDGDDPGFDDGLAIDNLRVSFSAAPTNAFSAATNGAFSLMTYNTHGNQVTNWSTNSYHVRAIGRQLVYLKPDIITFNEIPDTNTWQMENWVKAFLPGYFLATNSESDGAIRNVIASRFPIRRSQSWLHACDLVPFGCTNSFFKRDLFEAEIAVPDFPQPLHVFSLHLKSGQDADAAAQRAAEAGAVSNFLATIYLPTNGLRPYVLSGDMNEDLARPPAGNPRSIQRLISPPTGLQLTSPLNPFTQSELTFSIQNDTPTKRYDYILPCALLFSNLAAGEVFRTDLLTNPPFPLWTNDDKIASDHLPVILVFKNPYESPFRLLSIARGNPGVSLNWESVPGQAYRVETSRDLALWSAAAQNLLATGVNCSFDTNTIPGSQFFRVRREP